MHRADFSVEKFPAVHTKDMGTACSKTPPQEMVQCKHGAVFCFEDLSIDVTLLISRFLSDGICVGGICFAENRLQLGLATGDSIPKQSLLVCHGDRSIVATLLDLCSLDDENSVSGIKYHYIAFVA